MRIAVLLLTLSLAAPAMPPRPGVLEGTGSPLPVYPPGVEVAGPNRLMGATSLETVTILMQFPDNKADTIGHSTARFDSMLYSTGVYKGLPYRQGSLNDFYLENSYGNLPVVGGVGGDRWFMSTDNYSHYYDGDYLLTTGFQLAEDDMAQVDAYVDFSQFDLDHDGHIPACFMVHAGADGSDNGDVNCLWSHAIPYFSYQTNDGVIIDGVTNVPEYSMVTEDRDTTMCCIAVMCHEMGHLVGLPDLYDQSRNDWGPGYWGLMSYGAWGAGGNTPWSPSHMEAWSKVTAGFVTPTVITHDTYDLRIPDVETHPVIFKVWRNGAIGDTCFYLENREQKGFDTPLPGHGLCIWHIDPGQNGYYNIVDMEEDSTDHLSHGFGSRPDPHVYHPEMGDTSDPLPGNWNRTTFDSTSKPNSRDNSGHNTRVSVFNIRQAGDTIICDVNISGTAGQHEFPGTVVPVPLACSPNPFSRRTRLTMGQELGHGQVSILASSGALVWRSKIPESGRVEWTGTDLLDRDLPEGVYLVKASRGSAVASTKLVLDR